MLWVGAADKEEDQPTAMARSTCVASLQLAFPFAQDMKVFPSASHDLLDLDSLLSPKAKQIRDKTRAFMVQLSLGSIHAIVYLNTYTQLCHVASQVVALK